MKEESWVCVHWSVIFVHWTKRTSEQFFKSTRTNSLQVTLGGSKTLNCVLEYNKCLDKKVPSYECTGRTSTLALSSGSQEQAHDPWLKMHPSSGCMCVHTYHSPNEHAKIYHCILSWQLGLYSPRGSKACRWSQSLLSNHFSRYDPSKWAFTGGPSMELIPSTRC